MFGEGEEQDVEEHDGDAYKGVLHGMDGGEAAVFDKEDHGKGEQYDEVGVFDAAGGLLVLLDGNFQLYSEWFGFIEGTLRFHHLGKIAVQSQHFPVGFETLVVHFAVGG